MPAPVSLINKHTYSPGESPACRLQNLASNNLFEEELIKDKYNYDIWFDYTRLEE